MTQILDHFTIKRGPFRPKDQSDLLLLRLAQKLDDCDSLERYLALRDAYSDGQLLTAYTRATSRDVSSRRVARFHQELQLTRPGTSYNGKGYRLLALRVERRAVAAAVFEGEQLEFTQVRHLSSTKERALASTADFVGWLLAHLPVDSAAIEHMDSDQQIHRRTVQDTVVTVLHEQMVPIWDIPKRDLLDAYGHPPLRSRGELRQVVTDIWPVLRGRGQHAFVLDAVALGLHIQIERQFIH